MGALALALLALSGCASLESMKDELLSPRAKASAGTQAASDGGEAASARTEPPPLPRRKPEAVPQMSLVVADPDQVFGLDFNGTKALLGEPAAEIEKPPARVWAYNGGTCMFNVFFYPSVDDRIFRVLAYEVTGGPESTPETQGSDGTAGAASGRSGNDPLVRRCFAHVLHSQREPDAG